MSDGALRARLRRLAAIRRVVEAVRLSDMAQLGQTLGAATGLRERATALRTDARQIAAQGTIAEMQASADWQVVSERRARAADADAAALYREAALQSERLAQSTGRVRAVDHLIADDLQNLKRAALRREE